MMVGGQHHAPAALPPGKTRYPLFRRLGGPQCRSGRARKTSPPQGFDPRTVQSVASRYTDCAIPDPCLFMIYNVTHFLQEVNFVTPVSSWGLCWRNRPTLVLFDDEDLFCTLAVEFVLLVEYRPRVLSWVRACLVRTVNCDRKWPFMWVRYSNVPVIASA